MSLIYYFKQATWKKGLLIWFLLSGFVANAQQRILWEKHLVIDVHSFKDKVPVLKDDQVQDMSFYTTYDFGFQMSNAQFMFTKNFNKQVEAYHIPEHSWIEPGNSLADLIALANLQFDISELYARKLRKALYENKKVTSSPNFFQGMHEELVNDSVKFQAEINSKLRTTQDWTDILATYSQQVNLEIETMSDYCRTCKPNKAKRKID